MNDLIKNLITKGYLKSPQIIEAFKNIDRQDFVPENLKDQAYNDTALPIGWGQTISQPLTVAFMLELLSPQKGDKILDIGYGSGWQTAMLAYIVGKTGRIIAIERISELAEFGRKNILKYKFDNIELIVADGTKGYEKEAPYDKIIAAASAESVPEVWLQQLKINGVLVTPIKYSIWRYTKISDKEFKKEEYPGFVFVPLIKD